GSRRARIARGSGTTATDINQLLERFAGAQKMMQQMARGGGMPAPGMGNLPGMGGKKSRGRMAPQPRKSKVKGRSGNPAKCAQQEREAAMRAAGQKPKAPSGSAFGLGGKPAPDANDADPQNLEIPPGLEKFLGR